jgi:glutamyl-tRNA synthetase
MHTRAFVALSGTMSWFAQRTNSVKLHMSAPGLNDLSFETAKKLAHGLGSPRMRFAPSPTGSLHVGGARTALFNWLVARQAGHGKFVLRIEDTDILRSTRESEESMLADLKWLGLDWDEGPGVGGPCGMYRQSERSQIYREAADFLFRSGHAYPCFCTDEELDANRIAAKIAGSQVSYDGTWRDANPVEIKRLLEARTPHTYRFRTPKHRLVSVDDKVRGRIEWDVQATIGDFILLRSSGIPVYNFCVAVDDALMGVTMVVRAEEHLTNTVRQLLVLEALGFEEPNYAHASLILGSDKSKLSKRHGAASCSQFRELGYLPDAMVNYLALLGWNDGTNKEVYSRQELIEAFDISRVTASPAMFDDAKLRWLNRQHLRAMPLAQLLPLVNEHLTLDGILPNVKANMTTAMAASAAEFAIAATTAALPKAELVTDIIDVVRAVLTYPFLEAVGSSILDKRIADVLDDEFMSFAGALVSSYDAQEAPAFFYDAALATHSDASSVSNWLNDLGDTLGRSKKRLLMPARLALTGDTTGVDVSAQLKVIQCATHAKCGDAFRVSIDQRIAMLREYIVRAPGRNTTVTIDASAPRQGFDFATFSKLRQIYESNRRTAPEDKAMFAILKAAYNSLD